jgi:hypothetical protein
MFRLTVTSEATCATLVFYGTDEYIIDLLIDFEAMGDSFHYHVQAV